MKYKDHLIEFESSSCSASFVIYRVTVFNPGAQADITMTEMVSKTSSFWRRKSDERFINDCVASQKYLKSRAKAYIDLKEKELK